MPIGPFQAGSAGQLRRYDALPVQGLAAAAGAMKCTPLAVSGAFHTPLMAPARERLTQVKGSSLPTADSSSGFRKLSDFPQLCKLFLQKVKQLEDL